MESSPFYILISIIILAVIAILVFVFSRKKQGQRLTPIAGLAFAFVLAGLFLGDNRLIGYSFLGVGLILAIIDIVRKSKKSTGTTV